jgi:RNA polymerase sigma-70 factor (ECF subfamily)
MSCSTLASAPIADEADLVARLQAGDAAAFERLVRAYGPRMLSVARRFLGNDEDAQDALQDAFLSAFRSRDRFAGESQLGTWLHRIVVNASLMRLRTRRRRPETSIDDLLPRFLEDGHQVRSSVPWRQPVDILVQRREMAELVRGSIDELPENYRIVLLLRDIEERDTEETARLLEISVAAVKTRLHRARQALRTLLDAHLQGDSL